MWRKEGEEKRDFTDLKWLEHQYYGLGRTIQDIADDQGVSMITIKRWLVKIKRPISRIDTSSYKTQLEAQEITCPNCGQKLYSRTKFCVKCGENLTKIQITPAITEGKGMEREPKVSLVSTEYKSLKTCPKCRQKLYLNAKFCVKCGENLIKPQSTPALSEEKGMEPELQIEEYQPFKPISEQLKERSTAKPHKSELEETHIPPMEKEEIEEKPISKAPGITPKEIHLPSPSLESTEIIVKESKIEKSLISPEETQPVSPISKKKKEKPKDVPLLCKFCGAELNKKARYCPQCGSLTKKK
ncbi:MAG: zinc ribbon domain-containing protein [Promethearchaeota archaeon]